MRFRMSLSETFPTIHPDVTTKRLAFLARLIAGVWKKVRNAHKPVEGDTMLGYGVRFHERMCHALRQAALKFSWLRLIERRRHFVFTIGAVPFRVYRGHAKRPKKNYLVRQQREQDQQTLAGIEFEWCCRLAVEGVAANQTPNVILVQQSVRTGKVRNEWHVLPTGRAIQQTPATQENVETTVLPLFRDAAEQSPPQIAIKRETKKAADDDGKA